jgi:3',5'-cyclic-AMP phosphodiesterase
MTARAFANTIRRFGSGGLFVLTVACMRTGEERTRHDLDVGHARSAALDVDVDSGLAAVRSLSTGHLALWLSAPSIELTLNAQQPLTLELSAQNAMPALELTELGTDTPLPLATGAGTTNKSWQLELAAGSTRFRLATPDAATSGSFRFALMSDVQEAIGRVQDIYDLVNQQSDVSFLLGAGDLTEGGEIDELERFQQALGGLSIPYYTTLGNHELGGEQVPPYQDWFGRCNFQFVYRGVYFTLLDSASATIDPIADGWLETWLANARGAVHVVDMHIPPFDPVGSRNAAFASRAEAATLVGKLARAGVDLTLYGHIHSYYSFENGGIKAYISGGGGATPERADHIGRHFMLFDIDPVRGVLDARVVPVDHGDEIDAD